jgi:Rrf2 family protein
MLKLTKKADYGLIALKHLSNSGNGGSASAKEIADLYHIPLPLLAKVLQRLTKSGLLRSLAGTNGGYLLNRDPRRITALEVIRAIDGPILLTSCFTTDGECDQSDRCNVREPLRRVHEAILHLLGAITISDMSKDEIPEAGCRAPEPASSLLVL